MAYTPTNWQCGDVVTAEKLNNIESGIGEALECCGGGSPTAPLILQIETDETDPQNVITYLSTPFATIRDAFLSGRMVLCDPGESSKYYHLMVGLNVRQYGGGEIGFADNSVYEAGSDEQNPTLRTNA